MTKEPQEDFHYCNDWDGLLIHKHSLEACYCNCINYSEEDLAIQQEVYIAMMGVK